MRSMIRPPCGFERLESRQMMAGNVTAQLVDGDLIVTGDVADNTIQLRGNSMLEGLNDENGIPTSINGVPNGTFDYSGLTGNVSIRTGDGNDRVFLELFLDLPGAVVIETGSGNDFIGAGGIRIGREFIMDLGPGSNRIAMRGSTFRDGSGPGIHVGTSVIINGGDGNDSIRISELFDAHDFVVNTHGGADSVNLLFVTPDNFLGVDGGAGEDGITLGSTDARVISLRSGGGGGFMGLFNCEIAGDLGMIATDGNTHLRLDGCIVRGTGYLISGGANDYIQVDNSIVRELQINAGGGSDRVDINGSLLERVFAELGAGGDLLVMNNTAISGAGSLSGGLDFDVFFGRGNAFGPASLAFFELFT